MGAGEAEGEGGAVAFDAGGDAGDGQLAAAAIGGVVHAEDGGVGSGGFGVEGFDGVHEGFDADAAGEVEDDGVELGGEEFVEGGEVDEVGGAEVLQAAGDDVAGGVGLFEGVGEVPGKVAGGEGGEAGGEVEGEGGAFVAEGGAGALEEGLGFVGEFGGAEFVEEGGGGGVYGVGEFVAGFIEGAEGFEGAARAAGEADLGDFGEGVVHARGRSVVFFGWGPSADKCGRGRGRAGGLGDLN